jgi:flagellar hook protein FlgE
MNAQEIARNGLHVNEVRQAVSAHNTANTTTDGFSKQTTSQQTAPTGGVLGQVDTLSLSAEVQQLAQQVDGAQNNVDITQEMVDQIQARENFKQNAQVIRAQDQMQQTLLDTLA